MFGARSTRGGAESAATASRRRHPLHHRSPDPHGGSRRCACTGGRPGIRRLGGFERSRRRRHAPDLLCRTDWLELCREPQVVAPHETIAVSRLSGL